MSNLIGISGKIGSGKDTAAEIIQHLTNPMELDMFPYEVKKFAGKLKTIASILTGIPVEKFEDQEFKKQYLGEDWNYQIDQFNPIQKMTVRELLQKLGTDGLRDGLHTNVWVNALFADYNENSNWLVTDARFPNEAKAIKDLGGVVLRIERSTCQLGTHPSETALDDYTFDYVIHNNGSKEDLQQELIKFLDWYYAR
jgi:hypothetical protein